MNKSNILIVIVWLGLVGSSIAQGFALPASELARQFSFVGSWIIALPVVVIIGSLYGRRLRGGSMLGRLLNRKYGRGTNMNFLARLKPDLLLASMAFGIGVVGVLRGLYLGGPRGAFIISGFFLSSGIAFLATHILYDLPL